MTTELKFEKYFGDKQGNGPRDLKDFPTIGTFFKSTEEIKKSIKFYNYYETDEFRNLILQKKADQELKEKIESDPREKIKMMKKIQQSKRIRKPTKAELKQTTKPKRKKKVFKKPI